MCDYCDCRSEPEIAELSAEHVELLGLLGRVERGADPEALAALRSSLARHAAREERGVFEQLRRAGIDDAYLGAFEHDHEVLHRGGVDALADLRDHILREESDLFPAAHQLLSPTAWDTIAMLHDRT